MKACEEYLLSMLRDLDGEATSEEASALHAHLAECAACRELYESYLAIDNGIKATEEEPPEQLTAAIMNSIRREKTQNHPKTILKRFRFTAIAAAAAIIVLVAAKLGSGVSYKSAAIQSFGTAAETEAADVAAAPAEAPEMAAEFRENGTAAEEFTEKMQAEAEAPQKEIPGPVPAPAEVPKAAEEEEAQVEAPEDAGEGVPAEEGSADFLECIERLQSAGYSGTVVYMKDVRPEELEQAFPNITTLTLEGGLVVYEIQETDLETALTQFPVAADYNSESDGPLRYFIYLKS